MIYPSIHPSIILPIHPSIFDTFVFDPSIHDPFVFDLSIYLSIYLSPFNKTNIFDIASWSPFHLMMVLALKIEEVLNICYATV